MTRVREIFLHQEWGRSERYHVLDGTLPVDILCKEISRIAEAALP